MSQAYSLQDTDAFARLRSAVGERAPVVLTYRTTADWAMVKTRFAVSDSLEVMLAVDWPSAPENTPTLPEIGQEIGASFRSGSRKCIFTSCLADLVERTTRSGRLLQVLHLTWPETVQELQRRLYHRTPVPQNRVIPVDLWLAQAREDRVDSASPRQGKMLDISAGGLSVELPRDIRPRWREDTRLACRFSPDEHRDPLDLNARLTNYTRLSDGHVRLGLQFVGLDTSQGRQSLQRIRRMTARLRS